MEKRLKIPSRLTYPFFRWFHGSSSRLMVSTTSLLQELSEKKFNHNISIWSRGVDCSVFSPGKGRLPYGTPPRFLYVGRIAPEKNLPAFLELDLPGTKIVVGDGPLMKRFRSRYPGVLFTGMRFGESLASIYASADVLVFPSRTDTFRPSST